LAVRRTLPGSNTVTSGDIVRGAVRTSDIRNSTVRGGDVRNNTLTGNDVNESSLGLVPRSNVANAANFAGAAGVAGAAVNSSTTSQINQGDVSVLTEGETETLFTRGDLTATHVCADANNNNVVEASLQVTTSSGAPALGQFSVFTFNGTPQAIFPGIAGIANAGESIAGGDFSVINQNLSDSFVGIAQVNGGGGAQLLNANPGQCISSITAID
jgi:hypothetical protein